MAWLQARPFIFISVHHLGQNFLRWALIIRAGKMGSRRWTTSEITQHEGDIAWLPTQTSWPAKPIPLSWAVLNGKGNMVQMNLYSKQKHRHRCREQINRYQEGKRGWDELEECDWHVYTIDTMHKISNQRAYYSAQGPLLGAPWWPKRGGNLKTTGDICIHTAESLL